MKFSAYMFIRNGIRAGYTFMEAIENVLPFVDEFFVLEGESDDGTLEALKLFSKWNAKMVIQSKLPQYVRTKKDESGLLLGAAFEEARQKCDGDWLVQVQADTVFHPITILAAKYFLMQKDNARRYDAIKIVRHQYRWNWQEMYREDYLNLIFKKSVGRVCGDAIDIGIKGKTSKKLLPLFNKFPAADNAWVFFDNIMRKIEGCFEIWESHTANIRNKDFSWYNEATGRSFKDDLRTYHQNGSPPPFWQTQTSPFKNVLPENLWDLIGKERYEVAPRFMNKNEIYHPTLNDLLEMVNKIDLITYPIARFMRI